MGLVCQNGALAMFATTSNFNFFQGEKKMKKSTIFMLLFLIGATSNFFACTDESRAARVLRSKGHTDINITGYRYFGCSEDDVYHTGFKAKGINGRNVSGVVCCGIMKGCTVRYD